MPVLTAAVGERQQPLRGLSTLRAIGRHSLPNVVEATVAPTVLFYIGYGLFGIWPGLIAALAWAYAMVVRRRMARRRIPGLLILSVVGLTARTAIAFATGSTFLYFVGPILGTVVVAAMFFLSTLTDTPLVDRLAADFCPLAPAVAARLGIRRLFRRLTVMWGVINLANAGVTFWLLLSLPVGAFVALKAVTAGGITWGGVAITVAWSLRVARQERLVHHGGLFAAAAA
ncbi:MAG TPA: VC0807 family protein [Mycobacteriales bacterium]|nr:VC0807 family protein [Mycobacteriales bacterium]